MGREAHSGEASIGATSSEKRSRKNQRHTPWDPAVTAFLGYETPKISVEEKHGSREVQVSLHLTESVFLITGAPGPLRVGETWSASGL